MTSSSSSSSSPLTSSSSAATKTSQSSGVVCEHNSLIRRQFMKIESLETELAVLRLERDGLLGENERLQFQLQCLTQLDQNKAHNGGGGRQEPRVKRSESRDGSQSAFNTDSSLSFDSIDSQQKYVNKCSISRQSIGSSVSHSTIVSKTSASSSVTNKCCQSSSNQSNDYELSQQLIDRRVEALERKYGGIGARHAATRIQRAFRTYRLQKRFKTIAIQALREKSVNTCANTTRDVRETAGDSQSTRSDDSSATEGQQHSVFIADNSLLLSSTFSSSSGQQVVEWQRKRLYRVALNLFNKHPPERGVQYLLSYGFVETAADLETQALLIARFLLTRKGVSKAMIGEYVSTLSPFNALVLKAFAREIDLSNLQVDSALRKFQTYFRFPGEAQKIERLVDCFATRYIECNSGGESARSLHSNPNECLSRDSVFILSFAIIMLNTDLHSATNWRNRMTGQQWLQNLSNVFAEGNLSEQFLLDIYHRIKSQELRTGADHVTQVAKVQSAIVAATKSAVVPNLCLESRRLVCYCRLYEIRDHNKKESKDRHQREVFLFNDLLLVTKLSARAKSSHQMPEYVFRQAITLEGLCVQLFSNQFHRFGIHLQRKLDAMGTKTANNNNNCNNNKALISLNARNDLDQKRFCDDLKESILEVNEMEKIRTTNQNQKMLSNQSAAALGTTTNHMSAKKSNSLLALHSEGQSGDGSGGANRRKSSSGSLDSGLSLPSRDHSPQQQTTTGSGSVGQEVK